MATYQQLVALDQLDSLRQQVKMAVAVAALNITNEADTTANHANRVAWAKAALSALDGEVDRVIWHVLASNQAVTVAQIESATDAQVQTAVNTAVNLFAS